MRNPINKLRLFIAEHQAYYAFLKYNSLTKLGNLLHTEYSKALSRPHVSSYPYKLILDATNACNLKCPCCPTGRGLKGREKGFMTFERYKKVIDELKPYIYIVDLFNWGEPLLNRDIHRMIEYAESNNICTTIHTNLNRDISPEYARSIVESGLSYLSVSLDGADQAVYSDYRRSGDFEKALDNARLFIGLKSKPLNKPFITWQFLVFPHNRHQAEQARKLSREMGFDSFRILAGVTTGGLSGQEKTPTNKLKRMKDIEKSKCDWLWTTATFHWDEAVGPCCLQFKQEDDFGSIKDMHFMDIWNNNNFLYARRLMSQTSKQPSGSPNIICNDCYKVKRYDGN